MKFTEDQTIENQSFTDGLNIETFDNCTFTNCDFTNANIEACTFTDCVFNNCNFSMTNLSQSTFDNAEFTNSKILGVKFNHCNDFIFKVGFCNCILDYSSFEKRKMSKTLFKDSSLKGVDFGYTNLEQAQFINCDLTETIFYSTNIQKADFTSAHNYIVDLTQNQIKKARFSKDGLAGLLNHFDIIIE